MCMETQRCCFRDAITILQQAFSKQGMTSFLPSSVAVPLHSLHGQTCEEGALTRSRRQT